MITRFPNPHKREKNQIWEAIKVGISGNAFEDGAFQAGALIRALGEAIDKLLIADPSADLLKQQCQEVGGPRFKVITSQIFKMMSDQDKEAVAANL